MRRLTFVRLPARGAGEAPEEGTVLDLLRAVPYLLGCRIVPPLPVLNELLGRGESEAGMSGGCRWTPFALTPEEFEELVVAATGADTPVPLRYVEPPSWVGTLEEWHHWTMEYCHEIPAGRSLEYSRRILALEDARAAAEREGNVERLAELAAALTALAGEYSDWLLAHRQPHRWEREAGTGQA